MAHAARSLDDSIKSRELIERRVCVCVCVCNMLSVGGAERNQSNGESIEWSVRDQVASAGA